MPSQKTQKVQNKAIKATGGTLSGKFNSSTQYLSKIYSKKMGPSG